jgi:ABC-type Fe3+ transport system permease subunit
MRRALGLIKYAAASAGLLAFASAMVYPPVVLVIRSILETVYQSGEPAMTTALPMSLLLRSVLLAAAAAILAVALAMPAVSIVGRLDGARAGGWIIFLILLPLLLPPMMYAFGWQRLIGVIPGWLGCIWVWASWAWPIPAFIIGAAWIRSGRQAYLHALTVTGGAKAFLYIGLPALRGAIVASFLVVFVFFLGEYSVPHAWAQIVFATGLMDRASSSPRAVDTLLPSLPIVFIALATLAVAAYAGRRAFDAETSGSIRGATRRRITGAVILVVLVALSVGVPLTRLVLIARWPEAATVTVEIYGTEIGQSILLAVACGASSVLMGICLIGVKRLRTAALVWSIAWAALPGALVGHAIVLAYLPIPSVYDHWIKMLIGYLARFGWIGIVAAWLVWRTANQRLIDAARVDGATDWEAVWHVAIRKDWLALVAAIVIITVLSVAELPTTSLVRVSSIAPISTLIVEKFHRMEDDLMIGLSLSVAVAALPAALIAAITARRWP